MNNVVELNELKDEYKFEVLLKHTYLFDSIYAKKSMVKIILKIENQLKRQVSYFKFKHDSLSLFTQTSGQHAYRLMAWPGIFVQVCSPQDLSVSPH